LDASEVFKAEFMSMGVTAVFREIQMSRFVLALTDRLFKLDHAPPPKGSVRAGLSPFFSKVRTPRFLTFCPLYGGILGPRIAMRAPGRKPDGQTEGQQNLL
jgi:hypothetical protein